MRHRQLFRWFSIILVMLLSGQPVWAAVSCSLLTQGSDATNASSYATASITPTANRLILLAVSSTRNVINDCAFTQTTGVTGNSLTWVRINRQCYSEAAAPTQDVEIYRALGSSPSSGAVTIAYTGSAQANSAWAVLECSGIDTSGTNGSGAIVQNAINTAIPGTSLTMTLGAFGSSRNATLSAVSIAANSAITNEGGYTELAEQNLTDGGLNQSLEVQFLASNDTTPSVTFASNDAGGVAVEIKAAPASRRGGIFIP